MTYASAYAIFNRFFFFLNDKPCISPKKAVPLPANIMRDINGVHIILICLVAINLITFFLYGIDKWKAKRSKWRIEEATLLWWAALGGSIGALLGMKAWHHKTLHKKFKYGVPLILIIQVIIILLIYYLYTIHEI